MCQVRPVPLHHRSFFVLFSRRVFLPTFSGYSTRGPLASTSLRYCAVFSQQALVNTRAACAGNWVILGSSLNPLDRVPWLHVVAGLGSLAPPFPHRDSTSLTVEASWRTDSSADSCPWCHFGAALLGNVPHSLEFRVLGAHQHLEPVCHSSASRTGVFKHFHMFHSLAKRGEVTLAGDWCCSVFPDTLRWSIERKIKRL